ncbi:MAG TPA: hypothetical protein VK419_05065 [Bryobacteraceae bacterium]|nr:hypothetical protein [Bryobacteraceae bacterium]
MFIRSLLLTSALFTCAFGQEATTPVVIMRNYSFPPVGLANTETAQVNVVNTATASPAAGAAAPACSGTITFTNASGATVDTVNFTTTGSNIFSTDLSFGKLASSGNRAEFIANVELNTTPGSMVPCSAAFSLETFDTSGVTGTHVYLSSSAAAAQGPILPLIGH